MSEMDFYTSREAGLNGIDQRLIKKSNDASGGGSGGGDVTSVNGETGDVVITASDVDTYTTAEIDAKIEAVDAPVTSVNTQIGDVVLTAEDVGALDQDTADTLYEPIGSSSAVTSVNGETGDVVIDAEDLDVYTKEEVDALIDGSAGGGAVDSVNGQTGVVVLTASDIGTYTSEEIDALLDDKADQTEVDDLTARVTALEGLVVDMQAQIDGITVSTVTPATEEFEVYNDTPTVTSQYARTDMPFTTVGINTDNLDWDMDSSTLTFNKAGLYWFEATARFQHVEDPNQGWGGCNFLKNGEEYHGTLDALGVDTYSAGTPRSINIARFEIGDTLTPRWEFNTPDDEAPSASATTTTTEYALKFYVRELAD